MTDTPAAPSQKRRPYASIGERRAIAYTIQRWSTQQPGIRPGLHMYERFGLNRLASYETFLTAALADWDMTFLADRDVRISLRCGGQERWWFRYVPATRGPAWRDQTAQAAVTMLLDLLNTFQRQGVSALHVVH